MLFVHPSSPPNLYLVGGFDRYGLYLDKLMPSAFKMAISMQLQNDERYKKSDFPLRKSQIQTFY
ncbi:hypothetical protein BCV50_02940 [Bacillus subtilis]|nr:hypothetical protein BCV50_02940 [Bacillus subtilis]